MPVAARSGERIALLAAAAPLRRGSGVRRLAGGPGGGDIRRESGGRRRWGLGAVAARRGATVVSRAVCEGLAITVGRGRRHGAGIRRGRGPGELEGGGWDTQAQQAPGSRGGNAWRGRNRIDEAVGGQRLERSVEPARRPGQHGREGDGIRGREVGAVLAARSDERKVGVEAGKAGHGARETEIVRVGDVDGQRERRAGQAAVAVTVERRAGTALRPRRGAGEQLALRQRQLGPGGRGGLGLGGLGSHGQRGGGLGGGERRRGRGGFGAGLHGTERRTGAPGDRAPTDPAAS